MKQTFIYITSEDKAQIVKLSQDYKLSISATMRIICDNYLIFTQIISDNKKLFTNYIKKGDIKICCHFRETKENKLYNYTCIDYTNAIYIFLHADILKETYANNVKISKLKNLTSIKQKTIKQLKEAVDRNYMLNEMIKTLHYLKKVEK